MTPQPSKCSRFHLPTWLLLAFVLFVGIRPATGATLTTTADARADAEVLSDPQTATAGTVVSAVELSNEYDCSGLDKAFARASANVIGALAGHVSGRFANPTPNEPMLLEGTARWTETLVNASGVPQLYFLDYNVLPSRLKIFDPKAIDETSTSPEPPVTEWGIEAFVEGNSIFQMSRRLTGGTAGHVLTETGPTTSATFFSDLKLIGYDFGPASGRLELGVLPDGGSLTVEYVLVARSTVPGSGLGAEAIIGDPLDVGTDPGFFAKALSSPAVASEATSWGVLKHTYR